DGTECEYFVHKLRQTAFAHGKLDDNLWMAQFASTCLLGKALRWYVGLDSNTKNDWETLEAAMLEKWPLDSDDDDDQGTVTSLCKRERFVAAQRVEILGGFLKRLLIQQCIRRLGFSQPRNAPFPCNPLYPMHPLYPMRPLDSMRPLNPLPNPHNQSIMLIFSNTPG
ncbi:hypothetical protein FRB99_001925, partial [Tulasnella sp. 403]